MIRAILLGAIVWMVWGRKRMIALMAIGLIVVVAGMSQCDAPVNL